MLTQAQREKLEKIFTQRAHMRPIKVLEPTDYQAPAGPEGIFELQKIGEKYYLIPTNKNKKGVLYPDGIYVFVILADDPGRIYCGSQNNALHPKIRHDPLYVEGHTSLSGRKDILFAGGLHFENRVLKFWNNGSGHYKPSAIYHLNNFIPATAHLLPKKLFHDYNKMTIGQQRAWSIAQGGNCSSGTSSSSFSS